MEKEKKIDLLYNEYIRLNQRVDHLIDASLQDFKLLGFIWPVLLGIGTMITGNKLPQFDLNNSIELGFGAFLAILLIVGIIGFRDFLKLSLINYHIYLISGYESSLSNLIDDQTDNFQNIKKWNSKFVKNHSKLYLTFSLITLLPLIIIPTLILYQFETATNYWLIYLLIALCLYLLHFIIGNNFLKKPMNQLGDQQI